MNFQQYEVLESSAPKPECDDEEAWSPPLFLAPRAEHDRTFIILHGRGDNAYSFGFMLAAMRLPSSGLTLPEHFPEAKFIFPSSKPRQVAIMRGAKMTQWFDMSSLQHTDERQELQYEGLSDSTLFIHDIIKQEAKIVGLDRVILGGLSQGCALGLHVMMSFPEPHGEHLGGFFGMSGWLPFAKQLEAISKGNEPDSPAEEPVAGYLEDSSTQSGKSYSSQAIRFVRETVVKVPDDGTNTGMPAVPIFLGHGELDRKIVIQLGEQAAQIMGTLGWKVTWKSYPDLAHWYCAEELEDVANFLRDEQKGT